MTRATRFVSAVAVMLRNERKPKNETSKANSCLHNLEPPHKQWTSHRSIIQGYAHRLLPRTSPIVLHFKSARKVPSIRRLLSSRLFQSLARGDSSASPQANPVRNLTDQSDTTNDRDIRVTTLSKARLALR